MTGLGPQGHKEGFAPTHSVSRDTSLGSHHSTWTESLVLSGQGPYEVTAVPWPLAQRARSSCYCSVTIPWDLSPQSQCNSHILSGITMVLWKRNNGPSDRNLSITCTTPSSPVSHSFLFPCLMLHKDKSPTFRRLPFHLAVNPLGPCLLSFLLFFHHQYHPSLPLHWLEESWGPETSSNWNQHWMTDSLPSLLWKARVSALIHQYLTNTSKHSFSFLFKRKHRGPAFYDNSYLILNSI